MPGGGSSQVGSGGAASTGATGAGSLLAGGLHARATAPQSVAHGREERIHELLRVHADGMEATRRSDMAAAHSWLAIEAWMQPAVLRCMMPRALLHDCAFQMVLPSLSMPMTSDGKVSLTKGRWLLLQSA